VLGSGAHGQLGNGYILPSAVPLSVIGITSGATAVAAGNDHTCAVLMAASSAGEHTYGQLGDGFQTERWTAVQTGITSGATAVAAGNHYTCAVVNGGVWCWGYNNSGQLGNNSTSDSSIPVSVTGISSGATAIAAGGAHTCAIVDGVAKCWGDTHLAILAITRRRRATRPWRFGILKRGGLCCSLTLRSATPRFRRV